MTKAKIQMKEELLILLKEHHIGAENYVSSIVLESRFNLEGVKLRRIINTLRCEGKPICSDTNGYFYAKRVEEIELTSSQMLGRIKKIVNAVDGLIISQKNFRKELEVESCHK